MTRKILRRRLLTNRHQFLGLIIIVALATAFLTVTLLLVSTVRSSIAYMAAAPLTGADVVIQATPGIATADQQTRQTWLGAVNADPRVSAALGVRSQFGEAAIDDTQPSVQVMEIANVPELQWFSLRSGRWPQDADELVVEPGVGLRVGDRVSLETGAGLEPREAEIVGISDTPRTLENSVIHLYASAPFFSTTDEIRYIVVHLSPSVDGVRFVTEIQDALGDGAQVSTGEQARAQAVASSLGSLDQLQWMLGGLAGVSLVVGAILIRSSLAVLFAQRQRNDALLRLVGMTRQQVTGLALGEGTVLGACGALLGSVLGTLVGWVAGVALRFGAPTFPTGLWPAPFAVLAGTGITALAAWGPSRKAGRTSPMQALVQSADRPAHSRKMPRLFAVLLRHVTAKRGVTTQLAITSLTHSPGRVSAIAVAIGTCVVLVSGLLVGTSSAQSTMNRVLRDRYPIDLSVTGPSAGSLSDAAMRSIENVEGVTQVAEIRGFDGSIQTAEGVLFPVAVGTLDPSVQEVSAATLPEIDAQTVLVSQGLAWGSGLSDGDDLPVTVGEQTQIFKVQINGFPLVNSRATVLLSPQGASHFDSQSLNVFSLWIKTEDGANRADVTGAVSQLADQYGATLGGSLPERSHIDSIFELLSRLGLALLAASALLALIGVGNTLRLDVMQRQRETAILRSLGLTVTEVRICRLLEATFTSAFASVSGMLIGIAGALLGVTTALSGRGGVSYLVPWRALTLLVILMVGGSALAAWSATRELKHIDPISALADE